MRDKAKKSQRNNMWKKKATVNKSQRNRSLVLDNFLTHQNQDQGSKMAYRSCRNLECNARNKGNRERKNIF